MLADSMSGAARGTELCHLGASDADVRTVPTDGLTTDNVTSRELYHVWATSQHPG